MNGRNLYIIERLKLIKKCGETPHSQYTMKSQTDVINLSIAEEDKKLLKDVSEELGISMSAFIKIHTIAKAKEYSEQLKPTLEVIPQG